MSGAIEVSCAEPRPTQLDNFSQVNRDRLPEMWWRWGYLVDGSKPVMVSEHCRNPKQAEALARNKAAEIRDELLKLHAPAEVQWWTQKWTIRTVIEIDDAEVRVL